MKQKLLRRRSIALAAVIALCALLITACNTPNFSPENSVIIEITSAEGGAVSCAVGQGEKSFSSENVAAGNLHELLVALANDGKLSYEYSTSTYGAYVTNVGGLDVSAANSFVAFYHNLSDAALVYYDVSPIEYGGTTFRSSNVGVEGLPLSVGAKFLITVSTY